MLQIKGLQKSYAATGGASAGVFDISLDVTAREWVALLGPSGCGKTTTLRCVAGLETPDRGEVSIGGTVVAADGVERVRVQDRPISMVFQSYAIWPHMTVYGNVAFPLEITRAYSKPQIRSKVTAALEMVGIGDLADRPATRLSGGQQQRVAFARAIVKEAKLLLLDEPLSNLDAKLRLEMREELRQLRDRIDVAALYVTHDQDEALYLADRIVLMSRGHVVEAGSAEELLEKPRNAFTAGFFGNTVIWPCDSIENVGAEFRISTPDGIFSCLRGAEDVGTESSLVVRTDALALDAGGGHDGVNQFSAVIVSAVNLGRRKAYKAITDSGVVFRGEVESARSLHDGDRVSFTAPFAAFSVVASAA